MSPIAESWNERLRAAWRTPRTFTALIPVAAGSQDEVNARLAGLAPEFEGVLGGVDGLHSFRLAAVPGESPEAPVRILLNSVFDRPLEEHLPNLLDVAGTPLAAALAGAAFSRVEELEGLVGRHRVREQTFHLGAVNKTDAEILGEERLLEAMEQFADERLGTGEWGAQIPAERIRVEMRRHVLEQSSGAGLPAGPGRRLSPGARFLRFVDLLVTFALPTIGVLAAHIARAIRRIQNPVVRMMAWGGFGLWWVYGALPTGAALLFVRLLERIEPDLQAPAPDGEKVRRLEAVEDLRLKNAVTIWFPVRDTWVRRALLWLILWGSERGCRHFWTDGALAGIDTIHYARIMQVDHGRTMLFMSDYDGSLDRYLMDFLGVGRDAVIPISSSVAGCPPTRWLFHPEDPAVFGPRWRALIRTCQIETPVWYARYPNLSVSDVLSNSALRKGLFARRMSEEDALRWTGML